MTIAGTDGLVVQGVVEAETLKLGPNGTQDGQVLTYVGTSGLAEWRNAPAGGSSTGGSGWGLAGNANTDPENHYLGTSDDTALELRVNGEQALRIEPAEGTVNAIGGYNQNEVLFGAYGVTIGGGGGARPGNIALRHQAMDGFATISGGLNNFAGNGNSDPNDSPFATVCGGQGNHASGLASTVAGGTDNTARGDFSMAAGRQAQADHDGAFVWGDAVPNDVTSSADNQFTVRASGGVRFYTDGGLSKRR